MKKSLPAIPMALSFLLSVTIAHAQEYIENQYTTFQPATFRISGTGTLKNIITTAGTGEHITLRTASNSNRWNINLYNTEAGNNTGSDLTFFRYNDAGTLINAPLTIARNTGFVGIGTVTPQSMLSVAGTITAKKVKVTVTGWPDYVFHENYSLPSLEELEYYVIANKHLPGIPSAAAMEKEGLDVSEMNKQLLQKIEELTLYLIAEHKKNVELEKKVTELSERCGL